MDIRRFPLRVLAAFLLLIALGFSAAAQEAPAGPPIRNLKVLDEHSDGKGNLVTTVQFSQGNFRVTQTIIKPIQRGVGYMVPVRLDTLDKRFLEVRVEKRNYCVKLYYRGKVIRAYKAVFGPRPLENKCMEGDRCTPEGIFTITNKNPGSKYTKFMGISYPNDSASVRFAQLKKDGKIPATATIGGNVGIHGIWTGGDDMIELGVGWTDGCVALKNKDIEELYSVIDVGTKVRIFK